MICGCGVDSSGTNRTTGGGRIVPCSRGQDWIKVDVTVCLYICQRKMLRRRPFPPTSTANNAASAPLKVLLSCENKTLQHPQPPLVLYYTRSGK